MINNKLYILEVPSCADCPNIKICKIAWEHTDENTFPKDCPLPDADIPCMKTYINGYNLECGNRFNY